ncbi:LOW QUALITY PROTEIN: mediator of DNA damage checkpoint protein 1 [Coregonus clupeaformis]|uniref:LOW QUALITY PROTEIN: mediator of DNA damage checkpoint protein 1 n=1 Tax=Coregonus clupeaformis TaxID=59861 RepID=UPI001E1C3ED4|nr:LOW QUALITY PROTEIN: mediator of DNA damage checkpoint protein 1 [Coregonus clupeaformis]
MEATQLIDDSILEESEEEDGEKRGEPLAKLMVLKNEHIPETELLLYQGENVLGRNPDSCSLPLVARSVSKQHTVISISMFRGNRRHDNVAAMETEALVWDLGSMNGTRKGRTKLTPHVRYALTEGECVVIADIPCQYVSVDKRVGQGHIWNPTNADSGRGRRTGPDRKAQLRGSPSPRSQGPERETGTPKTERQTEGRGVNGEMGAPTKLDGKGRTPAKPLSFEQTPTQPERTLVPESESDSDGEREGRRDKRGKLFGKISDSESHMSSPTCSTFLSPTNKVIPESEDESPITPSSSAKNRPKKIVSFSEEESDGWTETAAQEKKAQVIVDDSEEEEEEKEGKEAKEALGEKETGKRTRGNEDVSVEVVNQVSQAERAGLTPSAPMVSTEDKFNTDSDTDVEGEEEMGLSAPVNGVKPPVATEPPTDSDPGQLHMDSDTDVGKGILWAILLGSDTDEEDNHFAPPASSRTAELLKPPTSVGPATAAPLEIRSDSDTDLEEDATQTMNPTPPNVATVTEDAAVLPSHTTTTTTGAVTTTIALRSQDSDADTDAEEEGLEPKTPGVSPQQGWSRSRTPVSPVTSGWPVIRMRRRMDQGRQARDRLQFGPERGKLDLGCSPWGAPLALIRNPALPPVLRPTAALSCSASDSQEDDDFVVSETQSFVLEGQDQGHQSSLPVEPTLDATQPYSLEPSLGEDRGEQPSRGSFQLGLSDSSHLHLQARDQASESTKAFSFPDGELEATQAYGAGAVVPTPSSRAFLAQTVATESTQAFGSPDRDSDLEATQAYGSGGGSEEPGLGRRSAVFARNRQVDFALEATQAYAAQPRSDIKDEDEEGEETQPLEFPTTSNVATAETLPMSACEEEEGEEEKDLVGAKPSTPESDDEEETKPDSPRRRGQSQKQTVEEEETQPSEFLTSSHISTAETQPMGTCDTEEEKEEDTKAKGRVQRERGKESEAATSGVSSRGRRGARGGEEEEEESSEPLKTQTTGKGKAVNTTRGGGRRGKKEGEKERLEMERREEEEGIEKEREEGTEKERLRKEKVESERVMKEQQERERMERDERLERERVETERMEREKREQEERERLERERKEREEQERLERERKEKERKRLESEEKEKQEKLERESREREEKERLERKRVEREEKEKMEREEKKKQERERLKMENKEKERLEMKDRDLKEKLERERLEREKQAKKDDENEPKTSTRGHRATTRRTITVPPTTQPQPELDVLSSQPEPVPASITRSRSNSSSSERSISSMGTQGSRGRGRGEGGGRPPAPQMQDILSSEQFVARRTRSRSSSTNSHSSLNSEVPTCSVASVSTQIKGRGGGRGRKTGTESVPPSNSQSEQPPAPKPTARGRRSQKVEDDAPHPEINEKADSLEAGGTTRGGVESKTGGKGRKWERGEGGEQWVQGSPGKANVPRGGRRRAAEEEGEKEEKPASTPAKRGRASTAQEEKSMEGRGEKMEEEETGTVQRKVRGRHSTVQIKKAEESVLDSNSMVPQTPKGNGRGKRSATVDSSPLAKSPRSSSASPLSSLSSPGTLCRARATTQSYKVLFTGVGDEEGGKVVSRLGGSLAKGVADMTHLVTDRVRRTVKFLCAVARGVPVVTTDWLDKCGKLGRFLPTDRYLVKDREQEHKFSFCLEESLRTASTQAFPLLSQGYEVHVTRSVLPEPAQMKDIITCSGARFLSKMPSTQKTQAQTVVISCGEDWSLCAPALSASLPVLSAEFLLTGILQQRVDLVTHVLSAPKPSAQPGGKGQDRGRKKT